MSLFPHEVSITFQGESGQHPPVGFSEGQSLHKMVNKCPTKGLRVTKSQHMVNSIQAENVFGHISVFSFGE